MSKLIDGSIPANTVCPFWDICGIRMERCPSPDKVKPNAFSCGAARAFDIMERPKRKHDASNCAACAASEAS